MILKKHKGHDGRTVIAICDSDLLGKKFEEGAFQLDLESNFYKGEEKSDEEVLRELARPCSVNVVGEKSVDFCLKNGIMGRSNVIKISGIPHAQCVLTD